MLRMKIYIRALVASIALLASTLNAAAFDAVTDTHIAGNAYPNMGNTSFIINTYGVIPVYIYNFTPAAMNVQFSMPSNANTAYDQLQLPLAIGLSGTVYSFDIGGNPASMLSNINTPRSAPASAAEFRQASLSPYILVNGQPYNADSPPTASSTVSFSNDYGFANIFAWFPSWTGYLSTSGNAINVYDSTAHTGVLSQATSGSQTSNKNLWCDVTSMEMPNSSANGNGKFEITVNDGGKYNQNGAQNFAIQAANMGQGAPVKGAASGDLLLAVLSAITANGAFVENNTNSSVAQGNFGSSKQAAMGSLAQVGAMARQLQQKLSNNSYAATASGYSATYSGVGIINYYNAGQFLDCDSTAMVQYTAQSAASTPLIDQNYLLSCTFRQPGPNGSNGGNSTADNLYVAIINNAVVASQQAACFIAGSNSQAYINSIKTQIAADDTPVNLMQLDNPVGKYSLTNTATSSSDKSLMLARKQAVSAADRERAARILGWLFAIEKSDPASLRLMLDNFGVRGNYISAINDRGQLQQLKTGFLALLKKNAVQYPTLQADYEALRSINY